jgi:hypothetical protein
MTKDDIIKMARETGMELYGHGRDQTNFVFILCRFANEVAAAERKRLEATAWGASQKWIERAIEAEREECARVVEQAGIDGYGTLAAAAAIRARGER